MKASSFFAFLALTAVPTWIAASTHRDWLERVPERARARTNPLSQDSEAPLAGAKLFRHDCASCHGTDASGHGSRPNLLTHRVHDATDGELEWLLTNGNLAQGMPSWSRLPETERWQIVRYLHSLR